MSKESAQPQIRKLILSNFCQTKHNKSRKDYESGNDTLACNTTKQTLTTKANTQNDKTNSYRPYLNTESETSSFSKTNFDSGFKIISPSRKIIKDQLSTRRSLKATIQKLVTYSNINNECKSFLDKNTSLKLTMTEIMKSNRRLNEEAKRSLWFTSNKAESNFVKSIRSLDKVKVESKPHNRCTELISINLNEEELRMIKDDCKYFLPSNLPIDTSKISKTFTLTDRINEEEEKNKKSGRQYNISESQINRLRVLKIMNASRDKPLKDDKQFYEQVHLYYMDQAVNEESARLKTLEKKMDKSVESFKRTLLKRELLFRRNEENKINRTEECMTRINKIMKTSMIKSFTYKLGTIPKFDAISLNYPKSIDKEKIKQGKPNELNLISELNNLKIRNRLIEEEEMKETIRVKSKIVENYFQK